MKTILYLSWSEITLNNLKFRNILALEKKKFKILYVDISEILFKKKFKVKKKTNVGKLNILKIDSYQNLKKILIEKKIDLILNFTGVQTRGNNLYDLLLDSKTPIVNILDFTLDKSVFFPYRLLYYLKNILFSLINLLKKKNLEYFICTGSHPRNFFNYSNRMIYLHSWEYEFLQREKIKSQKKNKIVSFLDQGWGFHPDMINENKENKGLKNERFNSRNNLKKINLLFNIFKKKGYKIYFLQHPKTNHIKHNILKNCKIIRNKTAHYVAKSEIILSFGSESTQYAVIMKKKIIFLKNEQLKSYPLNYEYLNYIEKFFKIKCLNLDDLSEDYPNRFRKIRKHILLPSIVYKKFIDLRCIHPKKLKKNTFKKIFENLANN